MSSPAWSPLVLGEAPPDPDAVGNVLGLLLRLIAAYNARTVARMLDVDAAMITRWRAGKPISPAMRRRIVDVHDIINRALQIFVPEVAARWLVGNDPLLGGARPIDVLAIHGVVPVIEALDGHEAGTYA
jgi:uncharacterized protein (DUF2384 family)